jgi:hypothetical protein
VPADRAAQGIECVLRAEVIAEHPLSDVSDYFSFEVLIISGGVTLESVLEFFEGHLLLVFSNFLENQVAFGFFDGARAYLLD